MLADRGLNIRLTCSTLSKRDGHQCRSGICDAHPAASGTSILRRHKKDPMDLASVFCTFAFLALLAAMSAYIHKLYRDLETQVYRARRKE